MAIDFTTLSPWMRHTARKDLKSRVSPTIFETLAGAVTDEERQAAKDIRAAIDKMTNAQLRDCYEALSRLRND